MKETPYSTVEKNFLKTALEQKKRLDGRTFDGRRDLKIHFGQEYGSCHVSLGETRVFAQVSSEIQQPKSTRPNEGLVYINVELSPMSAEHIEPGKPSEACIELTRVLEKCIRESRCIDLESLCIVAEEKAWTLRVDLTVLNIEGNVVECSSIAALAALAHFRRPDVTSTGEKIIIHAASEKDPIPTALHHFPICLTYAVFNKGKHIVADPSLIEEQTAEAKLSIGMNAYREICGIHLGGKAICDRQAIYKVVTKAGSCAAEIIQKIKQRLAEDEEARLKKTEYVGLAGCIRAGRITTLCDQRIKVKIDSESLLKSAERLMAERKQNKHTKWDDDGNVEETDPTDKIIVSIGKNSAELQNGDDDDNFEEDSPDPSENDGEEKEMQNDAPEMSSKPQKKSKKVKVKRFKANTMEEPDDDLQVVQELTKEEKERLKKVETLVLDDSEEEETSTLTAREIENPKLKQITSTASETPSPQKRNKKRNRGKKMREEPSGSRQWYPKNMW